MRQCPGALVVLTHPKDKILRTTLIKAAVLAVAASLLLGCGGGDPMSRQADLAEGLLKAVEAHKDDPAKATEAATKYIERNAGKFRAIGADLEKLSFEELRGLAEKHQSRMEALGARSEALQESNPGLVAVMNGAERAVARLMRPE